MGESGVVECLEGLDHQRAWGAVGQRLDDEAFAVPDGAELAKPPVKLPV